MTRPVSQPLCLSCLFAAPWWFRTAPRPRYDGFVLQGVAPAPQIPASNNILEYKAEGDASAPG